MSRTPFYLVVGLLVIVGAALSLHRHLVFEVPWTPGEQREIWAVEAQVRLDALDGPVKVEFALPADQQGFRLLGEHTASPGYGLAFDERPGGRIAQWSIRHAQGVQQLYYSADILVAPNQPAAAIPPPPLREVHWETPFDTAAEAVVRRAYQRSADPHTLARELVRELTGEHQGENARLLLTRHQPARLLVMLLNQAGVAAREVSALVLEDGRRRQSLTPWLQVYDGEDWILIDPASGRQGRPANVLLWNAGDGPVLQVEGGRGSSVSFAMLRQTQPASAALSGRAVDDTLLGFSIHSLPLEEQSLFRTILLIPIGALIVVMLRILVGIQTSGTFMPVLIALAFIQTSLPTGLIGFLLVVSVGLVIRSYLSHLNLLLVARVSAVIITVIGIISVFSVMSYRMGLNAGLTITFFPMIILAWTIERMSILWEEEGPREVLIQGGGSLLTAVLAYLAMTNPWVRHITFNFLGVQLIVAALILVIGNYTGYRLLELRRFRPIVER